MALVALVAAHRIVFRGLARCLIAPASPATTDFVAIPAKDLSYGDGRYFDAVTRLYESAPQKRILLLPQPPNRLVELGVLPSLNAVANRELPTRGVARHDILSLSRNRDGESPWDDASSLGNWLASHPQARVALLWDQFDSRRKRLLLDHRLPRDQADRVQIVPLADRSFDETDWWTRREGWRHAMLSGLSLARVRLGGWGETTTRRWNVQEYERVFWQSIDEGPR